MEEELRQLLLAHGASLVGFADLSYLESDQFRNGVSIAMALPLDMVIGIKNGPTREYFNIYHSYTEKLQELALLAEQYLQEKGYYAYAQTNDRVKEFDVYRTKLPHKTVATNAGLGWIGKSALFISNEYGPAVRLTSVLTDAPLKTGTPVKESKCGNCMLCTNACPGKAISGKLWNASMDRDEFFKPLLCRAEARRLAAECIGEEITLCGKCIEVCPNTYKNRKKNKPNDIKVSVHTT